MPASLTPATQASTAPADSSASGLPQFDMVQWPGQAAWLLFIFVVMFLLFARVFVPRIGNTIADREDRIAGDIGDARRMKEQADTEAKSAADEMSETKRGRRQSNCSISSSVVFPDCGSPVTKR